MYSIIIGGVLFACNSNDEHKKIKYYLTVHRLEDADRLKKFSTKLSIGNNRKIGIARFSAISNKDIKHATSFKWKQGYGLELLLKQQAYSNWQQEIGRDLHKRMILVVDGKYYSNAFYDINKIKNPVRLYCPLPKQQADMLAKQITQNFKNLKKGK